MQNSLVNSDSSTTFVLLPLGIWQSWWSFHWLCLFHGLNSEVRGVIAKDHYYPFSLSTLSNFQYIQALKTKKLKIKRWLTRERLVSCNRWIRFLWFGPIAKHYILAFLILILWCFSKQNFFWSVIDTRALQQGFQTRTVHWTVKGRGSRVLRSDRGRTGVEPWWRNN